MVRATRCKEWGEYLCADAKYLPFGDDTQGLWLGSLFGSLGYPPRLGSLWPSLFALQSVSPHGFPLRDTQLGAAVRSAFQYGE